MKRILGYAWCAPNTLLAAIVLSVLRLAGQVRYRFALDHSLVFEVVANGWLDQAQHRFAGITIGAIVLVKVGVSRQMLRHEDRHVQQQMITGPLAAVLYPLGALWSRITCGNWYRDNWFERDARRYAGEEV